MTPSPGEVSAPKSLVFLFICYLLSYLLLKRSPFVSDTWCSPPAFRVFFLEVASSSFDLFMDLWGRKCSPYPIPQPSWDLPPSSVYSCHIFLFSSATVRFLPFLTIIVPVLHEFF